MALPERGRIGVHNRSWYEEVLVVRVNEGILTKSQRLPSTCLGADIWEGRMRSIREFESHLSRNGTTVVKFFLNVGRAEQARRLVDRIDEPDKRWKFESGDLEARDQWEAYQSAYEAALSQTSTDEAPWYAIPADHKWTMRVAVAEVVHQTLERMNPTVPSPADIDWADARRRLKS
jgi:polyphosphate kinase 2 (PPK2 family)